MSVASNLYATPRRQFIHRPFIHSCFLSFGTIKPVPSRIVQCPGTRRKYEMKKAREGLAEGGASDNNFFSLSDTSDKPNRLGMLFYLGGGEGVFERCWLSKRLRVGIEFVNAEMGA